MEYIAIYKEKNLSEIKNTSYYKNLHIEGLLVKNFARVEELDQVIHKSDILARDGLRLILTIDGKKVLESLIGTNFTYENPKIRQAFYQFINFLINRGLRGFYFKNMEDLILDNDYITYMGELSKNTVRKEGILSIVLSKKQVPILNFLSNPTYRNFTLVDLPRPKVESFVDLKDHISSLMERKDSYIRLINSFDTRLLSFTNTNNYPFESKSLIAGVSYFLPGPIAIQGLEELGFFGANLVSNPYKLREISIRTKTFYQDILKAKTKIGALKSGTYRAILPRDPDIFAYVRTLGGQKVLVFGNFSQKEVLADIRFHFLDLYDFTYLLGNYGQRKIIKNLLLRPFEFVAFIKD